jgi:hypothetical protein
MDDFKVEKLRREDAADSIEQEVWVTLRDYRSRTFYNVVELKN